ncbi:MAG: hypothetical protein PHG65_06550 [Kiritimatiellae bacterium]|nr:hypothetical protein [Kiritimatiellia bacterium]
MGQLDCLGDVLGIGNFPEVKQRSVVVALDGYDVRLLALDALIEAKKAMNRPRDREAILQLQAIQERENERMDKS